MSIPESGELSVTFKIVKLIFVVWSKLAGRAKENKLLVMILDFFEVRLLQVEKGADVLITNWLVEKVEGAKR